LRQPLADSFRVLPVQASVVYQEEPNECCLSQLSQAAARTAILRTIMTASAKYAVPETP